MRLTAQEIYNRLINEDNILRNQGEIIFRFGGIDVSVVSKDVVGNIIQEWVRAWLERNDIDYAPSENTQMPPDFFLDPDDHSTSLLEVKAFDYTKTPAFDIADFRAYQRELIAHPYMLNTDYLIFGYEMDENGIVRIRNLWLKKVWEITRRMTNWPLNMQIKENVVHKIRPGKWYGNGRQQFSMFRTKEDFISAIEETVYRNPDTHQLGGTWRQLFLNSYEAMYHQRLAIPRWEEIADSYILRR